MPTQRRRGLAATIALVAALSSCGDGGDGGDGSASTEVPVAETSSIDAPTAPSPIDTTDDAAQFPDVVAATADRTAPGVWRFDVTVSSPYDTPERYADAWRVVGPDGTVYGIRELTHDHAAEQPFTRALPGVEIPDSVDTVTIEGRDLANGWGGATLEVALDA